MQALGNCPSCRGRCDADDALGWQHWRLLLVLICVFLITKQSYHSSFSLQPQSLAGVLLAEAGEAVCEVAVVGRCHWGLLCSLGPLGEVLSEHRGVILGFWQGLCQTLSLAGTRDCRDLPKASACGSCAPVHARPCSGPAGSLGPIPAQETTGTELPSS